MSFQPGSGTTETVLAASGRASSLARWRPTGALLSSIADAGVALRASAGRTYAIAVDTLRTPGTVTLSWRMPPSPPNDSFANAAPLPTTFSRGYRYLVPDGDNIGATKELGRAGTGAGHRRGLKWSNTLPHWGRRATRAR